MTIIEEKLSYLINILLGIKASDWIQIIIALILLATGYFSYKSIKVNERLQKEILLNNLIKEETYIREMWERKNEEIHNSKNKNKRVNLTKIRNSRYFNHYENLAISIYKNRVNEDTAKSYFYECVRTAYKNFPKEKMKENDSLSYRYLKKLFFRWGIINRNNFISSLK